MVTLWYVVNLTPLVRFIGFQEARRGRIARGSELTILCRSPQNPDLLTTKRIVALEGDLVCCHAGLCRVTCPLGRSMYKSRVVARPRAAGRESPKYLTR